MARANRLANVRLHTACAQLTVDEWAAPRTGFFPSIAATCNHILIVDRYYLDAIEEGGLGARAFDDEMPCGSMAMLAAEQAAVDIGLIAFCARLDASGDDAALARRVLFDRGARGRLPDRIDVTLAHVFMHATHHRGQVHAMLSGTSIAPPQLDEFIMTTDDVHRAETLAAAGMTEADLTP